jgi:uncharacterized phage protein gp47/JayE
MIDHNTNLKTLCDTLEIIPTGNWYVIKCTYKNTALAAQGESKEEARDKLRTRIQKFERRRPNSNSNKKHYPTVEENVRSNLKL